MFTKIASFILVLIISPTVVLASSSAGTTGHGAMRFVNAHQGRTWSNQTVIPARSNPRATLGQPQSAGSNLICDNVSDSDFFSLGYGGYVTLLFSQRIVNDLNQDIQIFEATKCSDSSAVEAVRVHASQDGINWTQLGYVTRDGRLDLGSLPWARYIRLYDVSSPGPITDPDGYDLDAVIALH